MKREIKVEGERSILKSVCASKDSLKQRAGRTGRVMKGHVIRLISQTLYGKLSETGEPEILKIHLLELTYRLKSSLKSAILPTLSELPTTPDFDNIK
eukprot:UN31316